MLSKTVVALSFWAEYPDDEYEADAHADRIADELTQAVDAFPYVSTGSVTIDDLDTTE